MKRRKRRRRRANADWLFDGPPEDAPQDPNEDRSAPASQAEHLRELDLDSTPSAGANHVYDQRHPR